MKKIFPDVMLQNVGPFVAMVVIFIHTIVLDRDLDCDCKNWIGCEAYMVFPFFIILLLQLWVQKTLRCPRVFRGKCKSFICLPFRFYDFFKAVSVALLWVISVLIDGDWWLCCGPHNDTHLACRDKSSLTPEEKTTIAASKTRSMVNGMIVLLVIVILAVFKTVLTQWCVCCESCFPSESPYYEALLQEEDEFLVEVMKTKAKEALKDGIEKHIWREEWSNKLIPPTIQDKSQPEPTATKTTTTEMTTISGTRSGGSTDFTAANEWDLLQNESRAWSPEAPKPRPGRRTEENV